jgi:hypothetical protein
MKRKWLLIAALVSVLSIIFGELLIQHYVVLYGAKGPVVDYPFDYCGGLLVMLGMVILFVTIVLTLVFYGNRNH